MRNLPVCFVLLALISSHGFGQPAPATQDWPMEIKPAPPMPDPSGVYEVGPGVTSPVMLNPAPVTDSQDILASCPPHMLRIVAVIETNGSVRIRTMDPHIGGTCDALALAALEHSQFQPGMLNDKPVPVAVCIRVPFLYTRPPVPRLVPCQAPVGFGNRLPAGDHPLRPPPGTKPPVLLNNVMAEFSDDAKRNKIQGVVIVSLVVDEEGMPTDIQLVRGVGHGLDENAIAAVSQYRFQPATLDGNAIAHRITVEVDFHLMK
jgi:TonB family protein